MSAPVYHVVHGGIATVILNRPERLNALDKVMWQQLGEVMQELDRDNALRAIVVRGAGDRAFAAGADIADFAPEHVDVAMAREYGASVQRALDAVRRCKHPTIAMVRGVCVGGGLGIAATCDLRICGESSRFGIPAAHLGLTLAYGELQGLVELVGKANVLEILLEGRVFGAIEAKEKGLVTRVVADDRVEEEVYATARRVADGAPLAAHGHKKFVNRLLDPTPLTDAERDEAFACFASEDFRAGVRAFLEKVKPEFSGR
ncbi:MAG: enoyl-CoA hydratase-related protein [Burkholderiales bacterium]